MRAFHTWSGLLPASSSFDPWHVVTVGRLSVCTDTVGRLRLQTRKPELKKGWETRPDFKYTLKSSHELLSSVVIDSPKLYSAHRKFSTAFNVLRNVIMFG